MTAAHRAPLPLLALALLLVAGAGCRRSHHHPADAEPTCQDGVQDGEETAADCGGTVCRPCGVGQACRVAGDCATGVCGEGGACALPAPTCQDGARDGEETAVDCGGPACAPCPVGGTCLQDRDCQGERCGAGGVCEAQPTCQDGVQDGAETAIDCGGGTCAPCALGQDCEQGRDCQSGRCGDDGACAVASTCGDGVLSGAEACDDGNLVDGDGCSSSCAREAGWICPFLGQHCLTVCGDGIRAGSEACDDGGARGGDGCSSSCQWEAGWACTGQAPGYTCHRTVCGDVLPEGGESCDDGNLVPYDGCGATCRKEPDCTAGAGCRATCGDGLVEAGESCDDGNLVGGDGCSPACQVEPGFTCSEEQPCEQVNGTCVQRLPMVIRDLVDSSRGGHPDFEVGCGTLVPGVAGSTLNAKGLPDLLSGSDACIQDATSFAQWYDFSLTGAWGSGPIVKELVLWDDGAGGYANRHGAGGTRWGAGTVTTYNNTQWCSSSSNDCAACGPLAAGETCLGTCTPWNNTATCRTVITTVDLPGVDGEPLFFPVDEPVLGALGGVTPLDQYAAASIPAEIYNGNWSYEASGARHNFAFTTHVRFWFRYDAARTYAVALTGDDDAWVYVNGKLAVDLGGLHVPTFGAVTLDAARAAALGLSGGGVYPVDVFQAERKQHGSTYLLRRSGFGGGPSVCRTSCGDGVVAPGEQCDQGTSENTGAYGHCNPDCTLGAYCGDGVVNGSEECDDGVNAPGSACLPGCHRRG